MGDARLVDEGIMGHAIGIARLGKRYGHRPFGCVIYRHEPGREWPRILSWAWGTESVRDPTRHSEMVAIQRGCQLEAHAGRLLEGATLVSTHQPCPMCAGAITHAKLSRVVFGSWRTDLPELFRPKPLALDILTDTSTPPEVVGDVRREECISLFAEELAALRVDGRSPEERMRRGG